MKSEELKIQADFIRWVQNEYPAYRLNVFAVDNNSQSVQRGALSKATGVKRGVSDLIFVCKDAVLFVEVKTETGKQSPEQVNFQSVVENFGHTYIICRSVDELKHLFLTSFNIF